MDVRICRASVSVVAVLAFLCVSVGAGAQTPVPGFPERPSLVLAPRTLSDRNITHLLSTLDALVARPGPPAEWGARAEAPLGEFVRQVQSARVSTAQETRIVAHLDAMARKHVKDAELVSRARSAIRLMRVGKPAPDIAGPDLDGRELNLGQYRGKVVLLLFSAEWCAICRTQEPYQRFMLEQYKNWPFAIVSVETGDTRDSARRAKADARLNYKSWWDGAVNGHVGSIASAWNVVGFPRTFLLDGRGVIRFVDVREEDLLKGVRQLLSEID